MKHTGTSNRLRKALKLPATASAAELAAAVDRNPEAARKALAQGDAARPPGLAAIRAVQQAGSGHDELQAGAPTNTEVIPADRGLAGRLADAFAADKELWRKRAAEARPRMVAIKARQQQQDRRNLAAARARMAAQ